MQHPRSAALRGVLAFLKLLELATALVRIPAAPEQPAEESQDVLPEYTSEQAGELLVSRYADGTVRRENPVSGVIQEDRPDGSLTVSLPGGRIMAQRYQGEPLLVVDLENGSPPLLGRLASAAIDGVPSLVYHYEDELCHHVIQLSTLRYFKLRSAFSSSSEGDE